MKLQRRMIVMMTLFILLSFSGCSQKKTETIYIKSPCPKLKTWENNGTIPALKIDYKVVPNGFFLKEKEFYAWTDYTRKLKQLAIDYSGINKMYEKQIIEFNKEF